MAKRGRPSTPRIDEYERADGEISFYARFTAYGERHETKVGETPHMTLAQAQATLRQTMDQVALGTWNPPKDPSAGPPAVHELFSDFVSRIVGVSEHTRYELTNRVQKHLLSFFHAPILGARDDGGPLYGRTRTLADLDENLVDDYMVFKEAEREAIHAIHARGGAQAVDVACPTCASAIGELCRRLPGRGHTGHAPERARFHPERAKAAKAARVLSAHERWLINFYGPSSRGLSAGEINKTLTTLRNILHRAMRTHPGVLHYNPAENKSVGTGTKAVGPKSWFRPEHVDFVLRGAAQLDTSARDKIGRQAAHATFIFAGLRNGELAQSDWSDVDWRRRILHVVEEVETDEGERTATAKTDRSPRPVLIVDGLYPILHEWWVACGQPADGLIWPTARTGRLRDKDNVRQRLWKPSIVLARALIAAHNEAADPYDRIRPMDRGLVPRSGRRSFAMYLAMAGRGPDHVMGQMGHSDAALALEVYNRVEREMLKDRRVTAWMKHPQSEDEEVNAPTAA